MSGAVWAVVGAHVTTGDRFTGVRMSVTGLEEWAMTPALEQTVKRGEVLGMGLFYEHRPATSLPFTVIGEDASITVQTVASASGLDVHGGSIRRRNRLELTCLSGWTRNEAMTFFVTLVQTLMTLLLGSRARVRSVEVLVGDRRCGVFGRHINGVPADAKGVDGLLLDSRDPAVGHLVDFVALTIDLSPVPHVVAAGLAGEFASVDTGALVMATSAESLDRRLRPGARAFDEATIATARETLATIDIDVGLRAKIHSAVGQYMWEPSMPQRLPELADRVAPAAPDCIDRSNRWKNAVTTMRVSGAHGLASTSETQTPGPGNADRAAEATETETRALLALHALAGSVRWALRIRVLQECGVVDWR